MPTPPILDSLLTQLAPDWQCQTVYYGAKWVLSVVEADDGRISCGFAAAPQDPDGRFQIGEHAINGDAHDIAQLALSDDMSAVAVGLATMNAIFAAGDLPLSNADAADWLAEQGKDKCVAIIGRFPFIDDELRPVAGELWVFEQEPREGEYGAADMPDLLPKADLVAITSSTFINHTIDGILSHLSPQNKTILLGASTPLTPLLFQHGVDVLFGVQAVDPQAAIESVMGGAGFRKLQGLQRVSLFRDG